MTMMENFRICWKRFLQMFLAMVLLMIVAPAVESSLPPSRLVDLCHEFDMLNTNIRDGRIRKSVAQERFTLLIEAIRREYYATGGRDYSRSNWVFPLKGYGYKAIGGVHGNGYQKGGYDFFDGNKHTGHPSQDIFIRDKKHVSRDDITGNPVAVLSLTGGVVVAVEKSWENTSRLRGGKYLWVYDPTTDALMYYAHNSMLYVELGDKVHPGDKLAEVGRTGYNAIKKRSPSHLHLTCLAIVNGLPVPMNIYKELMRSKLL